MTRDGCSTRFRQKPRRHLPTTQSSAKIARQLSDEHCVATQGDSRFWPEFHLHSNCLFPDQRRACARNLP